MDLRFVTLDHFLEEMRPLRQLLLDLLVDVYIFLQCLDLLAEIVVLDKQTLRLLRLELKLLRQLSILHDGQPRRCLLLLIVHGAQVRLSLLDFDEHLHS